MLLYRLLEYLSGQTNKRHIVYLPYKIAERIKVFLLTYFIK